MYIVCTFAADMLRNAYTARRFYTTNRVQVDAAAQNFAAWRC